MVDVASLLFMAGGALTYPLFFHLSLKKSLSIVSREKAANGRVLLSLIILYLETVALVMLSTPLSLIPLSYFSTLIALSAIVLLASLTLKALFGLSFRRGILAFALWQVLSLALGAMLMTAVLVAMFQTIVTIVPIIALMLLAWWMWGGKLRNRADGNIGHGTISLEPDRKIISLAIVILLCSSLLTPSAMKVVRCDPQTNSTEQDVNIDFNWQNKSVSGNIAWNFTQANTGGQGTTGTGTTSASGQTGSQGLGDSLWIAGNNIWNFYQGTWEAQLDFGRSFLIPLVLQNMHDAWRDREYLNLMTDITRLRDLLSEPPPPIQTTGFNPPNDPNQQDISRAYVRDGALADQLANMSKKDYKVAVAKNPDIISKAIDVERYVEDKAWASAAADLLTYNSLSSSDTFHKVEAETHDPLTALYEAGRVNGFTSPGLEVYEAIKSGDARRIGRAITSAGLSYAMLALILKSAWDVYLWWGGEPNRDACYALLTLFFEVDPNDIGRPRFDERVSRNLRALIDIAERDIDLLSFWREYKPNVWRAIFT